MGMVKRSSKFGCSTLLGYCSASERREHRGGLVAVSRYERAWPKEATSVNATPRRAPPTCAHPSTTPFRITGSKGAIAAGKGLGTTLARY